MVPSIDGLGYLRNLMKDGFSTTATGVTVPLHSGTSFAQCEFIVKQLEAINAKTTLEIGLAFGFSALAICDYHSRRGQGLHHIIDPFQNTESWHGLGLQHLNSCHFASVYAFIEEDAELSLPKLLQRGVKLDMAYIDAGKRMDDILLYSNYILAMLNVGGRIVFDDVCFPGVRSALRYLVQDKRVRVVDGFGEQKSSIIRKIASGTLPFLDLTKRILSNSLQLSDKNLKINHSCVVVEKISPDTKDWQWHPAIL
jgi:predicted O-methyltransferase YrrM